MFRKRETTHLQADPITGEVIGARALDFPAQLLANYKNQPTVSAIAGKNPRWLNLRDHPELSGKSIAIFGVIEVEGAILRDDGTIQVTSYVRMAAALLDAEMKPVEAVIIYTGSENVANRAMSIQSDVSPATPIVGTLVNAGRAWLLE